MNIGPRQPWRRIVPTICGILLLGFPIATATAQVVSPTLAPVLEKASSDDEIAVIVTFERGVDLDAINDRTKSARRARVVRALQENYALHVRQYERQLRDRKARRVVPLWIINGMAVTAHARTIRELAREPGVANIRLDSAIEGPETQQAEAGPAEWNVDMTRASELWDIGYTGAGVVVANVDTGVDADHPDYMNKWRGGSNSWFDPFNEYSSPHDNTTGHGTQVNGILVGGDASGAAIGVAPGAQWIAARIFDNDNRSSFSAIHQSFQWLLDPDQNPGTDDAPDIVNNSWGLREQVGQYNPEFLPDVLALRAAEIAVVFAAGNEGPNSFTDISPANYPNCFSVGSIDDLMGIEPTSSRGPSAHFWRTYPRVVAPGVRIRTTDRTFGGLFPNSYATVAGTSFSAPHVAGAMALLLSAYPDLTVDQMQTALEYTAKDLGAPGRDNDSGYGAIDVVAAFKLIRRYAGVNPKKYLLYR